MTLLPKDQAERAKSMRTSAFALLGLLAAMAAVWLMRPPASPSRVKNPDAPAGVARTNLVLLAGRLCLSGQTNAFTGLMIEHAANGSLRSRSVVSNGLLHGLSEGWYTNGQLQVTEHFTEGASHGLRTKWYQSGTRQSEVFIVDGKLHGTFRRWYTNGILAEQVEIVADQPQGTSLAYHPSGSLKARVVLQDGQPAEQKFWEDGEYTP